MDLQTDQLCIRVYQCSGSITSEDGLADAIRDNLTEITITVTHSRSNVTNQPQAATLTTAAALAANSTELSEPHHHTRLAASKCLDNISRCFKVGVLKIPFT